MIQKTKIATRLLTYIRIGSVFNSLLQNMLLDKFRPQKGDFGEFQNCRTYSIAYKRSLQRLIG